MTDDGYDTGDYVALGAIGACLTVVGFFVAVMVGDVVTAGLLGQPTLEGRAWLAHSGLVTRRFLVGAVGLPVVVVGAAAGLYGFGVALAHGGSRLAAWYDHLTGGDEV